MIVIIILFVLLVIFYVWCCCRASAISILDEYLSIEKEEFKKEMREMIDGEFKDSR